MIIAGLPNLQRVPSPLLYCGRRGGVPFKSDLAAVRLACASIAYLAGVSSSLLDAGASGVSAGRLRRTQDGFPRVCQDGALRILPTLLLAAARAEPVDTAAHRLACVGASYGGIPTGSGLESGAQRLAATGRDFIACASANVIESVTIRTAATGRSYQAAGVRSTSRAARQRLACVGSTYTAA